VRQSAADRALYYRQLRATVTSTFGPELTSATARDATGLVDRILAELIVEEEWAAALSEEFGQELASLTGEPLGNGPVTPERFIELRRGAADIVAEGAAGDDVAERARCERLVDVERRFLERVDELRVAVLAEDAASGADGSLNEDGSLTPGAMAALLRAHLSDSPNLRVTDMEVVPGGRSKETILVTLEGTAELPPEVIVRKDRPIGVLQTRAADEFSILRAVHAHGGIPVPRPYFAAEDHQGATLLVMERVRGTKAGEYFPDLHAPPAEHRVALGEQMAQALAHLHSISSDELRGSGVDVDAEVTTATVSAAVEGMSARIGELSGPPIAAVGLARAWLLAHMDDVVPPGPLCLLQGDVGLHNMLVDDDRLTALVDWEAATVGPPARELAATWQAATALTDWPDFVAAYVRAGGAADAAADERAIAYYRVFFALGACMSSRTGGHLFRTGAKRDLVTAHSGLDAHFRAQRNLTRALKDAGALGDA
jgi:aminoglycoside phosphotransferase (APT) family kinase protein